MNRSLLIVGAGGHGRVVADAAEVSGCWREIAFLDDRYPGLGSSGRWPVIGTLEGIEALTGNWSDYIVAIGDNAIRLQRQAYIKSLGLNVTTVVHPSAQIASDVMLGEGTVVFANAVINTGSHLGDAVIVNTAATLDHDNLIGSGVHISPGAHLAGGVTVGNRSWIGIGAAVIQGRTVGADVTIGAGGVATRDIADGITAVGVPAMALEQT
jgi:sugar O-acyltransferase (sialic acid O-acetyltransferase NeuD family)